MKRMVILAVLIGILTSSCSMNITKIDGRETVARAAIEQRALSLAIDDAFKNVQFIIKGKKKVYVNTQGLSKIDMPFISAYIEDIVTKNGFVIVKKEDESDIQVLSVVKVSGTDEIEVERIPFLPSPLNFAYSKVEGYFKANMVLMDMAKKEVMQVHELTGRSEIIR